MPEHRSFSRVNVAAAPLKDAAWPWRVGAGTHADSGAAVPAAGAVNPWLIGALGSGKSAMHGFVVGGGEDR